MSWASKHLGIRFDGHTLGNLVKNAAPLAAFTPLGVVGAGLLGASGGLLRGEKVGRALGSGLSNAALGAGATSLAGSFGVGPGTHLGLGIGGSPTPPSTPVGAGNGVGTGGAGAPPVTPDYPSLTSPNGNLNPIQAGVRGVPTNAIASTGAVPAAPTTPGFLQSALGFVKENPTAVGLGLQAAGSLVNSGSEGRLNNANARLLEQKYQETEADRQRRAAQDAFLNNGRFTLAAGR